MTSCFINHRLPEIGQKRLHLYSSELDKLGVIFLKIVYLWKNGQPVIVTTNEEGEYEYPSEEWTENKPDDGMYTPIYFDGQNG